VRSQGCLQNHRDTAENAGTQNVTAR